MTRTVLALSVAAAVLSGCSLIPDYLRPDLPTPEAWPQGDVYKEAKTGEKDGAPALSDVAWKDFFADPVMQSLIQQALDNNRDLRVATLNVELARATYRVSRSDLFPQLDGAGSVTAQHTPRRLAPAPQTEGVTSRTYGVNAGITAYELDLFGRIRSLNEQALEQYLATEEARNAAQISLVAEVANAYLTLLGDSKLLALTNDTLAARQKSLDLIEASFRHGVGSQLDVAQARTAVESARSNRIRYIRQVEQDKNALTLLVGAPIDKAITAPANLDQIRFVEDLPVGLPSEVLRGRPDIIGAEHSLMAANANVGAARAAFFPTITLTATGGTASPDLDGLFDAASGSWSFIPRVTVPIFTAGRNQANLDRAKANFDIALAQYEKSIQSAFREVSDALAAKGTLSDQRVSLTALVEASRESLTLSRARYDQGVDSYLSVLDSERALYSAEQDLVSIQVLERSNMVDLYKTLGGGAL